MSNELITNFKEKLHLDYYYKSEEKFAFLKWLNDNLNYANGVLKINENYTNTLTSQSDTGKGKNDLKNLIKSWFLNRKELNDCWTSLLRERLEYTNGRLYLDTVNNDYVQQEIHGQCTYETMYQGQYLYYLEVTLTPSGKGQKVSFDESSYTVRTVIKNTDSNLRLQFYSPTRVNRVKVHADAHNYQDVVYSGASTRITVANDF